MPTSPVDTVAFDRNRHAFPEDQLDPYRGQYVSWNAEGTRIVAAGESWAALYQHMKDLGIDPCTTVDEFIPAADTSYLPMGFVS